jgi:hypothetical protein
MIFLIPLLTLGIALWVFFDSQKRGYSVWKGLMWAVLVFMMLIVFLPLYLFTSRRKAVLQTQEQEEQPVEEATKCFYCGKPYPGNPSLCPNCGQSLKIG